jgi:hypothetical protein
MVSDRRLDMNVLKISFFTKLLSTALTIFVLAEVGLSPVTAFASTVGLPDVSNSGVVSGFAEHAPPVDPPFDTPAYYSGLENTPAINNGLVNAPTMMPASVPSRTIPGSDFGQAVVPVPAAVWLFGSGLLGLVVMTTRKKPT